MKHEPFGFFAPAAPPKRDAPAVPLVLSDFTKTDGEQAAKDVDPVGAFIKTQADTELAKNATASDDKLVALLFAPADSRVPVAPLRKDASDMASDWSWSTPVGGGLALEKSATGTAKERFRQQLSDFFGDHSEELAEAVAICDKALEDELDEMKTQAA